ncbi:MAG: hypothetical protein BM564_02930 [Bacteroidetes bacterium MedPE-SWsnd-G2]|nr:MAG: hypothetical protein BM564_02930 [Bacteroidetes bacterium MedPE-SWsnd-G2]
MAIELKGKSIDKMPLSMSYSKDICLNFYPKGLKELIEPNEIEIAYRKADLKIEKGDTVLIYTIQYRKNFNEKEWNIRPGISNKEGHYICGELNFTHYENRINLHLLFGKGRFRFIGLPLIIKGGTGSPVRAYAIFET